MRIQLTTPQMRDAATQEALAWEKGTIGAVGVMVGLGALDCIQWAGDISYSTTAAYYTPHCFTNLAAASTAILTIAAGIAASLCNARKNELLRRAVAVGATSTVPPQRAG